MLHKIKKVNVKDVAYWAAESWEKVTEQAIRKSWKKLWPTLSFVDTPEDNSGHHPLIELVNEIPGCEEADDANINEWMEADPDPYKNLNDEDIVAAVEHQREPDTVSSDDEADDADIVSHSDASAAFELALR